VEIRQKLLADLFGDPKDFQQEAPKDFQQEAPKDFQ
jgi:hypothetical protein